MTLFARPISRFVREEEGLFVDLFLIRRLRVRLSDLDTRELPPPPLPGPRVPPSPLFAQPLSPPSARPSNLKWVSPLPRLRVTLSFASESISRRGRGTDALKEDTAAAAGPTSFFEADPTLLGLEKGGITLIPRERTRLLPWLPGCARALLSAGHLNLMAVGAARRFAPGFGRLFLSPRPPNRLEFKRERRQS